MMQPRFNRFTFETWAKRQAIRKLGTDRDREQAEQIARERFPNSRADQQLLVAWLLAKPDRLQEIARLRRERSDEEDRLRSELGRTGKAFTMTRSEHLRAVVKSGGVTALCKRIVKDGNAGDISEHELTESLVASAKAAQPDLSDAQAFTRMVTAMSPAGEAMRKAITIAKAAPPSGRNGDGRNEDESDDEERGDEERDDAMTELQHQADDLHKRLPHLSPAQCFERVYSAPGNVELRKRERRQNSPLRRVV
jgi:hypothetical protein